MRDAFEIEHFAHVRIHARQKGVPRGVAGGSLAVGPSEGHARFCQAVDLGRVYIRMSEMAYSGGQSALWFAALVLAAGQL